MISLKQLGGGGDSVVKEILDTAAILGVDVIELLWVPDNRLPYHAVVDVQGYRVPIINNGANIFDDDKISGDWIDGCLKFYPDQAGRCWGYVYDTPENREIMATSLASGWYRIVDKKIREEIIKLAEDLGVRSTPYPKSETIVKISKRERIAEDKVKKLEHQLIELEEAKKKAELKLSDAKGKKEHLHTRRLKGVKVKRPIEEDGEE